MLEADAEQQQELCRAVLMPVGLCLLRAQSWVWGPGFG